MRNLASHLGAAAVLAVATSASAGVTGMIASVRSIGGYAVVDLFVGMTSPGETLIGPWSSLGTVGISTTAPGGFVQGASVAQRGWAPDTTSFTSTRDSLDSFATVGRTQYGDPSGPIYANSDLAPVGFATGTWNAAPSSLAATAFSPGASWFSLHADNPDAQPESLAGLVGRIDATPGAAGTNFGVWIAHLVLTDPGATVAFDLRISYKTEPTTSGPVLETSLEGAFAVPGPATGAALVLGAVGIGLRRRRA
jgi:hypothetical protein